MPRTLGEWILLGVALAIAVPSAYWNWKRLLKEMNK